MKSKTAVVFPLYVLLTYLQLLQTKPWHFQRPTVTEGSKNVRSDERMEKTSTISTNATSTEATLNPTTRAMLDTEHHAHLGQELKETKNSVLKVLDQAKPKPNRERFKGRGKQFYRDQVKPKPNRERFKGRGTQFYGAKGSEHAFIGKSVSPRHKYDSHFLPSNDSSFTDKHNSKQFSVKEKDHHFSTTAAGSKKTGSRTERRGQFLHQTTNGNFSKDGLKNRSTLTGKLLNASYFPSFFPEAGFSSETLLTQKPESLDAGEDSGEKRNQKSAAAPARAPRSASSDEGGDQDKYPYLYEMRFQQFQDCIQNRHSANVRAQNVFLLISGQLSQERPAQCSVSFQSPPGTFFQVSLRFMEPKSCSVIKIAVHDAVERQRQVVITNKPGNWPSWDPNYRRCKTLPLTGYSFSNHVFLDIDVEPTEPEMYMSLDVVLSNRDPNTDNDRPALKTVFLDPLHGYVETPGLAEKKPYPQNMNSCVTLTAPKNHIILTSFNFLNLAVSVDQPHCSTEQKPLDFVTIFNSPSCILQDYWPTKFCYKPGPGIQVHEDNALSVFFYSDDDLESEGFRMVFTFHASDTRPRQLNGDQWNCSIPEWKQFKQHFPCNLQWDCMDGEDEEFCPNNDSTSNVTCPRGFLSVRGGCYLFKLTNVYNGEGETRFTWLKASQECLQRDLKLASLTTEEETKAVFAMLSNSQATRVYLGLQMAFTTSPSIYQQMWRWMDGTIAYYLGIRGSLSEKTEVAAKLGQAGAFQYDSWVLRDNVTDSLYVENFNCTYNFATAFLCEFDPVVDYEHLDEQASAIELTNIEDFTSNKITLLQCPHFHTTHDFLVYDVKSSCWARDHLTCAVPGMTTLPPMYGCTNQKTRIAYSLVCDFRQDCPDNSDEDFCVRTPCKPDEFQCANKQCLPIEARCDVTTQCLDNTDEINCVYYVKLGKKFFFDTEPTSPPAIVDLEGRSSSYIKSMDNIMDCPPSHYQCREHEYCLPVFTRCNGPYDCPSKEDEAGCDGYTCPGYYRCRDSKVCLHSQHLCDGIHQCENRDDELLCDLQCPPGCTCFGWAWLCKHNRQTVSFHSEVRFLAAEHAAINTSDLSSNIMLVELRLVRCGLVLLDLPKLPNLRMMDFSDNAIRSFESAELQNVPNLKSLSLAGNPVTFLLGEDMSGQFLSSDVYDERTINCTVSDELCTGKGGSFLNELKQLDLSRVDLKELDPRVLVFPHLQLLNLTATGLQTIKGVGFQDLAHLRVLDLRGCPVTSFPGTVLSSLNKLDQVYADTYKLCCAVVLPEAFNLKQCQAPSDEVSSCEALLRSNIYRVLLALIATLALLGNLASLLYRLVINRNVNRQGFGVLVTNLCVSDGLMGVFMAIIGVADRLYMGTYLWKDTQWKRSPVCQLAGLLALLSSEVSTFLVCLVTLDRFLAIHFPFLKLHFTATAGHLTSTLAWIGGLGIAALPLLPVMSHWEFYGQVGICLPLPITRAEFPGRHYAFGVMIVLNSVLFLLLALGNVFIYSSIQHHKMAATESSQTSKDVTIARRLLSVVMSDFVCWFPVCLLGLMAELRYPVSGEVNVSMAIVVLPFNAALNPFLYTLNVLRERRRRAQEKRLIQWLSRQNAAKS